MKMLDVTTAILSSIVLCGAILLGIAYCGGPSTLDECEAAGYTDIEYEDGAYYCIRAEGNDLIGRSLEAIRVEARGQ